MTLTRPALFARILCVVVTEGSSIPTQRNSKYKPKSVAMILQRKRVTGYMYLLTCNRAIYSAYLQRGFSTHEDAVAMSLRYLYHNDA